MRTEALIAALFTSVALAGCVSDQPTDLTASSAGAPTATATAAPTTPEATIARGAPRPPGGANVAAETICVMAVQQATNAVGVAVIGSGAASSQAQPAETVVLLNYPAARAPWRCLTNADGRVTEVGVTSG